MAPCRQKRMAGEFSNLHFARRGLNGVARCSHNFSHSGFSAPHFEQRTGCSLLLNADDWPRCYLMRWIKRMAVRADRSFRTGEILLAYREQLGTVRSDSSRARNGIGRRRWHLGMGGLRAPRAHLIGH